MLVQESYILAVYAPIAQSQISALLALFAGSRCVCWTIVNGLFQQLNLGQLLLTYSKPPLEPFVIGDINDVYASLFFSAGGFT
jgi:hypothetical protein